MADTYLSSGAVTPAGNIDSVNTVFTLPEAPSPVTSLQLYLNGILLGPALQYDRSGTTPYAISGATITLKDPPQTGDRLVAYFSFNSGQQSAGGGQTNASADPIDLTTVEAVKEWLNTSGTPSKANAIEDANLQRCITAASRYWLWRTGRGAGNWQTAQQSPFNQAVQYDESYDGNGNDQLFLRNGPVISVQSVSINGRNVIPAQGSQGRGWMLPDAGNRLVLYGEYFVPGRQNIQVQYTAGFTAVAVTGELRTIPDGLGPYLITAGSLPWLINVGVAYFADGTAMRAVTTAPQQGEYFLQGAGQYLFNAADANQPVLLSYSSAGTPADVRLAATQMVAVNYKRRQWIDQASQSMASGAGTVSFRSWELPPEVVGVMNAYTRRAL
jgi:hypothetical protein